MAKAGELSMLQSISLKVNKWFSDTFFTIGFKIATNPGKWAAITVLVAIVFSSGWSQIQIEQRPEKLYTPQDSQSFRDKDWTEKNFGFGSRQLSVAVVANDPAKDNLLTKEAIAHMFDLWDQILALKVTHNGKVETLATICTKDPAEPAGQQCIRESPLVFWDYNRATFLADTDILATINSKTTGCCMYSDNIIVDRVFGAYDKTSTPITRAGAMNMNLYINQNRVAKEKGQTADDQKAKAFELEVSKLVREDATRNALTTMKFHPNSEANFDKAVQGTFAADGILTFFAYIVITVYASFVLFSNNNVASNASLGPLCVLCTGLAVGAGFGLVMCFKPFSLVVNSVIFVMLGIGVDDAFVILASIDQASRKDLSLTNIPPPPPGLEPQQIALIKKIAAGVSLAGASISLTSLTDFVAFLVGATTVIPALADFCLYASVTIMFDFFFQCTLFVAFVTWNERRKLNGQRDCLTCCGCSCCFNLCGPCTSKGGTVGSTYLPCGKKVAAKVNIKPVESNAVTVLAEQADKASDARESEPLSKRVIGRILPDFILSPFGKAFVLLLTAGLLAMGGVGCYRLKTEFLYEWFLPSGHWMKDSFAVKKDYFTGINIPFAVYTKEVTDAGNDYFTQKDELSAMVAKLQANKWVLPGSVNSWQTAFHTGRTLPATSAQYHADLVAWLASNAGKRYASDVKFNAGNTKVVASRISAFLVNPSGAYDQIDSMDDTRVIAASATSFHAISYTYPMLFWEGLKVVAKETTRNVILAAVMVFAVCLLVLADFLAATIVLTLIGCIDILLLGFIHWIGDYMNMVTAINLLLAIGLCVDYSAHICHSFLIATGTRDERARAALFNIGVPVFNGALTTLLATIVLSAAQSYVFQVFFRMFMLIVCFGIYFGMVVLPVVLSIIGPPSHTLMPESAPEIELSNAGAGAIEAPKQPAANA